MKKNQSLYKDAIKGCKNPEFKSNEEALASMTQKMNELAKKYGLTPDQLFLKAENSSKWDEDLSRAHSLYRHIGMVKYLISKIGSKK